MKAAWGVMVLLCCAALTAAEGENPFRAAKVGDWVSYKGVGKRPGTADFEYEFKRIVVKMTDDECTYEETGKFGGTEQPPGIGRIKLKEKFDENEKYLGGRGKTIVKDLRKGAETITIGGKAYKTKWVEKEITQPGTETRLEKIWRSTDVPFDGAVKTTGNRDGGTFEEVLTGCGRGK